MELALVAPVLILLVMGVWDVGHALLLWREVTSTAQEVAEGATAIATQPDGSLALTPAAAQAVMSAIYANMPGLRAGTDRGSFSVTLTGVLYATGQAQTTWSVPLTLGGANPATRPCGTLAQVAPNTPPSAASLPTAGIANLTSLVVADVKYQFTPLFSGVVLGPIAMWRSSYVAPRTGTSSQYIVYDPALGTADPAVCPGFL